jgi:hypothetical protein
VNQTDLVMRVLRDYGKPATTRQIHEMLAAAAGHNFSYEQARSALGYLKRKKRIEHIGPATWGLAQVGTSDSFTPAVETAGVSTAGENGSTFQGVGVSAGAGPNSQPASPGS